MDREDALTLVHENIKNKNLRKHMYACEAIMKALAKRLGGDESIWGIAGLVHDIDYELTNGNPETHGLEGEKILRQKGYSEEVIGAVLAHVEKVPLNSSIRKAIFVTDPTSGFLVACALIHPDKKLASINVEFIMKRMKEKRFASNVNREQMRACVDIGLDLEEFLQISLDAMRSIADTLGL